MKIGYKHKKIDGNKRGLPTLPVRPSGRPIGCGSSDNPVGFLGRNPCRGLNVRLLIRLPPRKRWGVDYLLETIIASILLRSLDELLPNALGCYSHDSA